MLQSTVPAEYQTMPLKQYLRQYLGISLTSWRKIKQIGIISINGQPATYATFIVPGDKISIDYTPVCNIEPINIPLTISYEDEYLLVVDKPAGMLVHPATFNNTPTLANAIIFYYQKSQQNLGFHPIHRLDRNTSGLVIIAKSPHIQHLFSQHYSIERFYLAVVAGLFSLPCGTIDTPIARHPHSIIERIISPNGKPAVTNYKISSQFKNASLVEIQLLTGRTHQIRVHMSSIGHPLLGDDLYGGDCSLIQRQALHAAKTLFEHPITHKSIELSSPMPNDIIQLINLLKLH